MLQEEVFKQFKKIFPSYSCHIKEWFPNGRNSVRIRMSGADYIFTYTGYDDWKFETVGSYIKSLKKGGVCQNVGLYDCVSNDG